MSESNDWRPSLEENLDTDTEREESRLTMGAETARCCQKPGNTKDYPQPAKAGKVKEGVFPRALGGRMSGPSDTFTEDL